MKPIIILLLLFVIGCDRQAENDYLYPKATIPFSVQVRYADGLCDTVPDVDRIDYGDAGVNRIILTRDRVPVAYLFIENVQNPAIAVMKIKGVDTIYYIPTDCDTIYDVLVERCDTTVDYYWVKQKWGDSSYIHINTDSLIINCHWDKVRVKVNTNNR